MNRVVLIIIIILAAYAYAKRHGSSACSIFGGMLYGILVGIAIDSFVVETERREKRKIYYKNGKNESSYAHHSSYSNTRY